MSKKSSPKDRAVTQYERDLEKKGWYWISNGKEAFLKQIKWNLERIHQDTEFKIFDEAYTTKGERLEKMKALYGRVKK